VEHRQASNLIRRDLFKGDVRGLGAGAMRRGRARPQPKPPGGTSGVSQVACLRGWQGEMTGTLFIFLSLREHNETQGSVARPVARRTTASTKTIPDFFSSAAMGERMTAARGSLAHRQPRNPRSDFAALPAKAPNGREREFDGQQNVSAPDLQGFERTQLSGGKRGARNAWNHWQ